MEKSYSCTWADIRSPRRRNKYRWACQIISRRLQGLCIGKQLSISLLSHCAASLHLFPSISLIRRLVPKPKRHESNPTDNGNPYPCNPHPTRADFPASGPLIVSKMPDSYLSFNIDIGKKGALVVDAKGENSMLVGELEASAIQRTIYCL